MSAPVAPDHDPAGSDQAGSDQADSAAPASPSVVSLDCLGLRCPRPVIELARHVSDVEIGGVIEVLADDPAAGPDLAAWCRMRGHELVATAPPRFSIRRLH